MEHAQGYVATHIGFCHTGMRDDFGHHNRGYRPLCGQFAGIDSCSFFRFFSAEGVVSLVGASCLPGMPGDLTAVAIGSSTIHLDWRAGIGTVDGFVIERSADRVQWSEARRVSSLTFVFDDVDLPCGTHFYYRVKAFNQGGQSPYSNTTEATTFSCEGGPEIGTAP